MGTPRESASGQPGTSVPRAGRAISRRGVLLAAGLTTAGALGLRVAADDGAPPAPAPAATSLRTLDVVREEAAASAGLRLAASPWQGVLGPGQVGPWSAVFASWLLRENSVLPTPDPKALFAGFAAEGRTGPQARPGALIFYTFDPPGSVYHVGFVDRVLGDVVSTIEGDVPGEMPPGETFVRRYGVPWDGRVLFGYPRYRGDI